MSDQMTTVLNLLGVTALILGCGLVVIGKWVKKKYLTRVLFFQFVAALSTIIAAFILKWS